VTILVDERPDGVHLSYDTMASFLRKPGSPESSARSRLQGQRPVNGSGALPAGMRVCVHDGNREFEPELLDETWAVGG
jgi:hypothetical protein